ncbi:Clp protease ClpP [Pedobacter sp. MC2016-05]|uniref:Clp protease ClpP n=1 Tax=Pedobacter sp. MC2016-05 TaxID=2994474 RepID=UPI0022474076|nr:Clp protease ClpP [Pedobacter sp. MC2016-05]MCX2473557.1 Clp protease ClpP [Pedobacter sp. MC2016-05]
MKKQSLTVVANDATKTASIYLYGIIGDFWNNGDPITAKTFQQKISALYTYNRIDVHLNGPGGDVHEFLAICNIINANQDKIHTWNDGLCASGFFYILASAKKENRHTAQNAIAMAHQAGSGAFGKSNDLREAADMLDVHDEVLAGILAKATGKKVDEVKALWFDGKDHWMTAEDTQTLGIATIESYDAQPVPENITAMPLNKVAAFYTPQNNQENMLGFNKFKSLTALAKVAAAEVTAEQVTAVNEEIVAQEIEGVTLVLDSELQTITADAGKVPSLNTQITALTTEKEAEVQKVVALTAEVAGLKKELNKPAVEALAPVTTATDGTPGTQEVTAEFETQTDREYNQIKEVRNLIP